ncbi:uncharacterized protein AtWU_04688 [Aspergillus tubingensis]|uniref:Uncharacterized protein n=1 Tax=Aspergillus niger TaxID=5061 RepID=A0A100IUA6_ASPNG|nr:uncharacterized protein AtWU_04688 [Aspergillus tubingensis]GAQ47459.1 hypothetical protein ABL_10120 [Aspergillus niger]GFN14888.1 hypothetical protein AtWU_04688 [Aspergillus tubingensis]
MRYTLVNLVLVGAALALPADLLGQNSKRDNQDAQKATVDDAYLPDLGAWTNFKRANQDAQKATVDDAYIYNFRDWSDTKRDTQED